MAGPDEFGLEAHLRSRTSAAGLTRSVIFPGMVEGALKMQLLARADLFCLPSAADGFSMAVLEALASGTAVLLSPGCHFPEVEQVGAGRVAGADLEALVGALGELLSDRSKLERMGQIGRRLVSERYSWEGVTNKLIDAYTEGASRYKLALNKRQQST
jgi:glycosyltransferase involved in cell wall biosynthesis